MSTLPTIHINGSARATLATAYEAAYRALTDALSAFAETSPNARDYYPQGNGAFRCATDEHGKHLAALRSAQEYCLAHYDHCADD